MTQGKMIGLGVFGFLALIFVLNCWHVVPPGERGIQTTFGTMNMEPLNEGLSFVNPFSNVKDISVQNRKIVQKHTAETIDTQTITLEIAVNFRPNPAKVAYLIKDNTTEWENVIATSLIDDAVKAELGLHKVTDVVKNRPLIKTNLESNITSRLAKYDVEVKEVNVTELDFSPEYDKAIEAKQVAEQDSQRMLNVLTKTKTEAEMVAAKARGDADAAIEVARGRAEALKIEGQAQAEYNEKVAKSLSQELLNRMWIEKWSGTLPTMMPGQNASFLMPISGSNTH